MGQIGPKGDKFRAFSDQISVYLAPQSDWTNLQLFKISFQYILALTSLQTADVKWAPKLSQKEAELKLFLRNITPLLIYRMELY